MIAGQKLGPFEIEKELGSGAMGTVYRARYMKTGQRVAIKIVSAGLCGNETALARFEREIAVLKQLNHQNIVRLLASGRVQKTPFYAMDYIEGESLDRVLDRRGRYTWEEVVELGRQLCSALQHAHEQGIVHRDLKPSNVMVLRDGTVKLTDFGIAKDLDVTGLTSTHCTVGTASYMSPEQCRGEKHLSHKSDLYSLGVMFYELVTGKKPFRAETTVEMFLLHTQGECERPSRLVLDIPVWFDTLICQLMEKKPEHRPFDASTVINALDRVVEKVSAQQSAGVDAAKARAIDRRIFGERQPDETDNEAARTLLGRRKKRKRRVRPFYKKGWFQAAGIVALLSALAGILYVAFKPATPEALYTEAKKLMDTGKREDRDSAREGPIKEFFGRYAERNDSQARQVKEWADKIDLATLETQLANRARLNLTPDNLNETTVHAALRQETEGDLKAAGEQWTVLERQKTAAEPEARVFGLLGEKRLAALRHVEETDQEFRRKVEELRAQGSAFKIEPNEQLALEATYFELFGDLPNARRAWEKIKKRHEPSDKSAFDTDPRVWFLLATMKVRQLTKDAPPMPADEEQAKRVAWLKEKVKHAQENALAKKPLEAWSVCQDILNLYGRTTDDSPLSEVVKSAVKLIDQLKTTR